MSKKNEKTSIMLVTAEVKWKFEKICVICRTWFKMVLSMNDLKAQALQEMKFSFTVTTTFSKCCQSVPQCHLQKEIDDFSVGFSKRQYNHDLPKGAFFHLN